MSPRKRTEPRWITRSALGAIHSAQLREHGGSPGVRDEGLLESALARPRQKGDADKPAGSCVLAAACGFALVKNHGFIDGNKRAAFMVAYSFLGLNGYDFDAAEPDVVTTIERAASGQISEAKLAEWFRAGFLDR